MSGVVGVNNSVEDFLALPDLPRGRPRYRWKFAVSASCGRWKRGPVFQELHLRRPGVTAFSGGQGLLNIQGDVDLTSFAGLFQCGDGSTAVLSAPELTLDNNNCGRSVVLRVVNAEYDRMRDTLRFFVRPFLDAGARDDNCHGDVPASLTRPTLCFDGAGIDPWQQLARETRLPTRLTSARQP